MMDDLAAMTDATRALWRRLRAHICLSDAAPGEYALDAQGERMLEEIAEQTAALRAALAAMQVERTRLRALVALHQRLRAAAKAPPR